MSRGAFIIGGALSKAAPNVRRRNGIDTGDAGGSSLIPAFSPLDIPKLSEWFSVESLVAGGAGPVGAWAGEKGLYTLVASTTARPTFDTDDGDGMPSVQFDGVDDALSVNLSNLALLGATGDYEFWFVLRAMAGGSRGVFHLAGVTNQQYLLLTAGGGNLGMARGEVQISFTGATLDGGWHVVRCAKQGARRIVQLDGMTVYDVTTTAGTYGTTNDDFHIHLASRIQFYP